MVTLIRLTTLFEAFTLNKSLQKFLTPAEALALKPQLEEFLKEVTYLANQCVLPSTANLPLGITAVQIHRTAYCKLKLETGFPISLTNKAFVRHVEKRLCEGHRLDTGEEDWLCRLFHKWLAQEQVYETAKKFLPYAESYLQFKYLPALNLIVSKRDVRASNLRGVNS